MDTTVTQGSGHGHKLRYDIGSTDIAQTISGLYIKFIPIRGTKIYKWKIDSIIFH